MRRPWLALGRSATGGGSVLIFVKNFCETFLRQIGQVINVNLHKSSFKVGLIVILVGLLRNLNFLSRFSKNTQTTHFMKTLSVGADLFHADEQADRQEEANNRLSQFCERTQESSTFRTFAELHPLSMEGCKVQTTLLKNN